MYVSLSASDMVREHFHCHTLKLDMTRETSAQDTAAQTCFTDFLLSAFLLFSSLLFFFFSSLLFSSLLFSSLRISWHAWLMAHIARAHHIYCTSMVAGDNMPPAACTWQISKPMSAA